jgi:putative flippase GtrA
MSNIAHQYLQTVIVTAILQVLHYIPHICSKVCAHTVGLTFSFVTY